RETRRASTAHHRIAADAEVHGIDGERLAFAGRSESIRREGVSPGFAEWCTGPGNRDSRTTEEEEPRMKKPTRILIPIFLAAAAFRLWAQAPSAQDQPCPMHATHSDSHDH